MKMPLYRQAISHGWQLAWKHKLLWVFGLFAAFLGQMGILELLTKVVFASNNYALYPKWLAFPKLFKLASLNGGLSLGYENWTWLICLILILLSLFAIWVFVSVVSQGAIIHSVAQSTKKKKLPDVGVAWHAGVKHFGRLFFINLFKKLILVLLSVAIGWGVINSILSSSAWSLVIFLILFLLSAIVGISLSFLVIYSAGYVVVEEYPLIKSIRSAWRLFTDHWLVSIEVALVILFLNIIVTVIVLAGFLLIFLPALIAWFIALVTLNPILIAGGLLVSVVVFTLFIMLVGSIFTVFTTSVWTYLFMKMHKKGVKSRILHWLGK